MKYFKLLSFIGLAAAQEITINSEIKFTPSVLNEDTLQVDMTCSTVEWCSIGFGSRTMTASDMVVFYWDGTNGSVEDRWSNSETTPTLDANQDWTLTSAVASGSSVRFVATRPLDTGETTQDNKINLGSTIDYSVAWGPNT